MSKVTMPLLVQSIVRLLDARGWTDYQWASYLSCSPVSVRDIRNGNAMPFDRIMTDILRELERTSGSQYSEDTSEALSEFWRLVEVYEYPVRDRTELFPMPLKNGESVAERVTRWTNYGWPINILSNIHLIPPKNRQAFIAKVTEVFNEFVKKD